MLIKYLKSMLHERMASYPFGHIEPLLPLKGCIAQMGSPAAFKLFVMPLGKKDTEEVIYSMTKRRQVEAGIGHTLWVELVTGNI